MQPYAIGIDLGGTQLRGAMVDRDGQIVHRVATKTDNSGGPCSVIAQFEHIIATVSSSFDHNLIAGIGISSPGPLDTETGTTLALPTMPGWENVPLKALVQERTPLPVSLENDALAATLGEWTFGAGRGLKHLCYVTVSTGIGGGVIIDGRLIHGRRGMATHIGHMNVTPGGRICGCGNDGCWEAYASGTSFARIARERAAHAPQSALFAHGAALDGPEIIAAARAGDALALELVHDQGVWLGIGFVGLLHLFSPEKIVVGGGLAIHAFDLLLPPIAQRIARYAMPPFRDVPVVTAELGGNSGLVGAAALAFAGKAS